MKRLALLLGTALCLTAVAVVPGWAQELYSFPGFASDGTGPSSGVIADKSGALYGTTNSGGTAGQGIVYKLMPPGPGTSHWAEQVLWNFGSVAGDGVQPTGDLLMDATGALYGVTPHGGASNAGTVYRLTPPTAGGGGWTETILLSFDNAGGGSLPLAGLIEDASGVLYGTTGGGGANRTGTVFKLTPPTGNQAAWTEQVLYSFGILALGNGTDGFNPECKLAMDKRGDLFGTTYNGGNSNGAVFELSPPPSGQTAWAEQLIYDFDGTTSGSHPQAGLTISGRNVLYGTTTLGGPSNKGTVFALAPPAGGAAWRFDLLHSFTGSPDGAVPVAEVKLDAAGNVYGTTQQGGFAAGDFGYGTVFSLTPPSKPTGVWVEKLYAPQNPNTEAQAFASDLLLGPGRELYSAAEGGINEGGTVFRLPEAMLQ